MPMPNMLLRNVFLLAIGTIAKSNAFLTPSTPLLMSKSLSRPSSTASFASSSASAASQNDDDGSKPRILCLHGKHQCGAIFSNKIAGARRKICREYDLHFLDGPILLTRDDEADDLRLAPRAWWQRSEDGKHTLVREAFDYIIQQPGAERYEGIIAFSQGGTLATALAVSGALPNVRVVVTSGAPYIPEAFEIASEIILSKSSKEDNGFDIPKLHLAGETDAMVSVESTRELCDKGGNGKVIVHEQGHLFPTRSARVKEVLDFLALAFSEN